MANGGGVETIVLMRKTFLSYNGRRKKGLFEYSSEMPLSYNIYCDHSLEPTLHDGSNDWTHYLFWWRITKFLLYFLMNYRDFSVKSKLIISLFQTVKLSLSISLFQKTLCSVLTLDLLFTVD